MFQCEVGRGMKVPRVPERLREFWDVMINVPTDSRLWEQVEQTLWDLGRDGVTVPLTDAVIACSAMRIGAVVLTYDRHFSMIPGVRTVDHLEE